MYEFTYHRPGALAEAVKLLKGSAEAKAMAGGHTLLPALKLRLSRVSDLVDLRGVKDLSDKIAVAGGKVTVGALARHADVAHSDHVKRSIPALAALAEGIGDPQVRHRGTIGGSTANNDPAADYPAGVLGLGATIVTTERSIAADDFFKGLFETALKPGELIKEIVFPVPEKAGYAKFPNPASRYAMVGVFVAKTGGGARVAVTGAGPCVFRAKDMEAALTKSWSADAIKDVKIADKGLNSDIHGSAEYRAHLVGVMARRAVQAAG